MNITAEERQALEQAIRDEIRAESLAKRAEWRRTHKAEIAVYNRRCYLKRKAAQQARGDYEHGGA